MKKPKRKLTPKQKAEKATVFELKGDTATIVTQRREYSIDLRRVDQSKKDGPKRIVRIVPKGIGF